MADADRALPALLARYAAAPGVAGAAARLAATAPDDTPALRHVYEEALPLIEQAMWSPAPDADAVARYQAAFRELEGLIAAQGPDRRHHFILIIPVADRPQHLTNILESLLMLCHAFGYGGLRDGRFAKVQVVIADDTLEPRTVDHNRAIVEQFTEAGLDIHYFGAEAQARELEALDPVAREALRGILGHPEQGAYRHKGASVNRDLAYLLANRLRREADAPCLFYFVDSDEQFKVRTADGRDLVAVNYLHHLDRIFALGEVRLLTGKVVGDPPVSPAVMAGNFLEDVSAFLEQMAALAPAQACSFHAAAPRPGGGDAAYHDMADLFGFAAAETYRYRCRLDATHDHRACFADFAARLDRFFDGEHPTRITDYHHGESFTAAHPARTVYTGNYVCDVQGLAYFVPFAPLRLRMAGPTLGRIIRAEIGERFVSANLPLLHTRTVDGGDAEFRPGVDRQAAAVDLSGEFERQFFGDVMLFSVERLTAAGYPSRAPSQAEVRELFADTEEELRGKYMAKLAQTRQRLARARALFDAPQRWWNSNDDLAPARKRFETFFDNIDRNFAEEAPGYRLIHDKAHRAARLEAILGALLRYDDDRQAWAAALDLDREARP